MKALNVILIFPPNFAVDQPYLALPALTAFLRSKGTRSVEQWDCNLDAFWYFLEEKNVIKALEQIKDRKELLEFNFCSLTDSEKVEYYRICQADISSDIVLEELDSAKLYFNENKPTWLEEYHLQIRTISKAVSIISAAHYPSEMSLYDFNMRFSCQSSKDIFLAVESPENPYITYYKDRVLPDLYYKKPNLVGISVACMSQIIPSFTLAKIIRDHLSETKIVFGGQVFNRLVENILKVPEIFKIVDYFIVREGETALLNLIGYLNGQMNIEEVPNLMYYDKDNKRAIKNCRTHIEEIDSLPLPDFSDLDLSRYLSPVPVLPYQPVRGCYWNKCAFCNHFAVHLHGERAKGQEKVVKELRNLSETYGTSYFAFVNESIRPKLLGEYSEAINKAHLNLEWYAGARFEPELDKEALSTLKKSGCRKIYFGLETGSQKVLDSMRKGISLKNAESILKNCGKLDIAVHLFLMLGFPTENSDDRQDSKEIICNLISHIPKETFTYYISVFQLKPCSAIFENPGKFGINSIKRTNHDMDLEYLYEFSASNIGIIDYESERGNLECRLDKIKGRAVYPENIIHFLTMHEMFDNFKKMEYSDLCFESGYYNDVFTLQEGLTFTKIKSYEPDSKEIVYKYLVYDYYEDNLFLINNPEIWNALKELPEEFDKEYIRDRLGSKLKNEKNNETIISKFVDIVIENRLVVLTKEMLNRI